MICCHTIPDHRSTSYQHIQPPATVFDIPSIPEQIVSYPNYQYCCQEHAQQIRIDVSISQDCKYHTDFLIIYFMRSSLRALPAMHPQTDLFLSAENPLPTFRPTYRRSQLPRRCCFAPVFSTFGLLSHHLIQEALPAAFPM